MVATAQYLTELAVCLRERGHEVTVLTSRRAYDDSQKVFPASEVWKGIRIRRLFNSAFSKRSKLGRATNFATFLISCSWRLLWLRRQDVVVALTSPPLVSVIAAFFARLRGSAFCYWIMDLNPDEAVAAGWLRSGSLAERALDSLSRFSLRSSADVLVLDRFMKQRIVDKGIAEAKVTVIPPWSHDADVSFNAADRERFRREHGLAGKFVVMYSGNHSPCHPLDTILGAAEKLATTPDIAFCFIGGGSQFPRVKQFAAERALHNVKCLPYQPLSALSASLSAADAHLVVMGEPFVGLIHPCKIYNVLRIGSPLLYVGPAVSHVTEIMKEAGSDAFRSARHGEVDAVVRHILELKAGCRSGEPIPAPVASRFGKNVLLPKLVNVVETAGDIGAKKKPLECSAA